MPTATRSAGTERYLSFDERRYPIRATRCKETISTLMDGKPQYEWEFALEGGIDPESGLEITTRVWCSTVWSEAVGKESHLVLMARALLGAQVTFEEWEALAFDDLLGKRATALVALNAKGYPAIDKTTLKPATKASAARQIDMDTGEVTTAPQRPAPPPRASATPVRSDAQRDRLLEASTTQEYDLPTLTNWISQEYPGKTLDTITPDECEGLISALDGAPF